MDSQGALLRVAELLSHPYKIDDDKSAIVFNKCGFQYRIKISRKIDVIIPSVGDWRTCIICSEEFRSRKKKMFCNDCAHAKTQLATRRISRKIFRNDPEKYEDIVRLQALKNRIRKQLKNTSL